MSEVILDTVSGPEREAELADLLNRSFPVLKGSCFYDDFPVWNPRFGAPIFRAVATRDGHVVSSAGARLAYLKAPSGKVPIALIGAVATDPESRGQGYASAAVKIAAEWAETRGAAGVFLWGSDPEFYERLGYTLCGRQARVSLAGWVDRVSHETAPIGSGFTPGIASYLLYRQTGLEHTKTDLKWLQAHKHVEWRWLGTPTAPRAYLAFNKGMDLQGLIHEWGGDPESLRELLVAVRREQPELVLLGQPEELRRLGLLFDEESVEPLCMARVSRPEEFERGFGLGPNERRRTPESLFGDLSQPGRIPLWFWGLDGA